MLRLHTPPPRLEDAAGSRSALAAALVQCEQDWSGYNCFSFRMVFALGLEELLSLKSRTQPMIRARICGEHSFEFHQVGACGRARRVAGTRVVGYLTRIQGVLAMRRTKLTRNTLAFLALFDLAVAIWGRQARLS